MPGVHVAGGNTCKKGLLMNISFWEGSVSSMDTCLQAILEHVRHSHVCALQVTYLLVDTYNITFGNTFGTSNLFAKSLLQIDNCARV